MRLLIVAAVVVGESTIHLFFVARVSNVAVDVVANYCCRCCCC